jgi:hypothetical protein
MPPMSRNTRSTRYAPGFAAPFNGCHGPRPCANHRSATILSHSQLILKKASGIATVAATFPQSDRCPMGLRCRDRARGARRRRWIAGGVCQIAGYNNSRQVTRQIGATNVPAKFCGRY